MLVKIEHLVVLNFNSFIFQKLPHQVGASEVVFAGKHTVTIYHAVCREGRI